MRPRRIRNPRQTSDNCQSRPWKGRKKQVPVFFCARNRTGLAGNRSGRGEPDIVDPPCGGVKETTTYFFLREQHLFVITGKSGRRSAATWRERKWRKRPEIRDFWNLPRGGFLAGFSSAMWQSPAGCGTSHGFFWNARRQDPEEGADRFGRAGAPEPEQVPDTLGMRAGRIRNPVWSGTFPGFVPQIEELTELDSKFRHNLFQKRRGKGRRYDIFGRKLEGGFQNCPGKTIFRPDKRTKLERKSKDMTFLERPKRALPGDSKFVRETGYDKIGTGGLGGGAVRAPAAKAGSKPRGIREIGPRKRKI